MSTFFHAKDLLVGCTRRHFSGFGVPPIRALRRVVVTGMGIVSPLGVGLQHNLDAIYSGKSGLKVCNVFLLPTLTLSILSQFLPFQKLDVEKYGTFPSQVIASVPIGMFSSAVPNDDLVNPCRFF